MQPRERCNIAFDLDINNMYDAHDSVEDSWVNNSACTIQLGE